MRVVKEAAVRRNEILDAAEQLFVTKGFDGTSTNDILEKVGIARGTLYYHFKSKEEILDAMIQRISEGLVKRVAGIAGQKDVPVLERSGHHPGTDPHDQRVIRRYDDLCNFYGEHRCASDLYALHPFYPVYPDGA